MPVELRRSVLDTIARNGKTDEAMSTLSVDGKRRASYIWQLRARPDQLPPEGDWLTWLYQAGRGAGKTRAAAEWVRWKVDTGQARRIALLGREPSAAREVMVGEESDSGLINVYPPGQKPDYEPALRQLTFHNGAVAFTYSSANPDQLRGPQHDLAWVDELAAFRNFEAWDNLQMGLRLGRQPQQVVSTTPRPIRVLRELTKRPSTVITRATSYANRANLSDSWFENTIAPYIGTPPRPTRNRRPPPRRDRRSTLETNLDPVRERRPRRSRPRHRRRRPERQ